jgi:hypothetical protein
MSDSFITAQPRHTHDFPEVNLILHVIKITSSITLKRRGEQLDIPRVRTEGGGRSNSHSQRCEQKKKEPLPDSPSDHIANNPKVKYESVPIYLDLFGDQFYQSVLLVLLHLPDEYAPSGASFCGDSFPQKNVAEDEKC